MYVVGAAPLGSQDAACALSVLRASHCWVLGFFFSLSLHVKEKIVIPAHISYSRHIVGRNRMKQQRSFPHNVPRPIWSGAAQERHCSFSRNFSHDFAANIIRCLVIQQAKADQSVKQFSAALSQLPHSRFYRAFN